AADHRLAPGVYRLRFDVATYFRAQGKETFYPSIPITFEIRAPGEHYHVPLLLNPFGYTTYRGS
ncbi:MAG: hydroxyisourate hydrolase, partial [Rhodothermales bacterium]